jgi:L-seryl-tRNA(Sec) kinase
LIEHFTDIKVIPVSYDEEVDWTQTETKWRDKRKAVLCRVENIIKEECESSRLIILDDNMYYRSMRYEYYQLARGHKCSYCQVLVEASMENVTRRNASRLDPVPGDVIQRMSDKLERPEPEKYSWEKYSLVLSTDSPYPLSDLEALVAKALAEPAKPIVEELKPQEEPPSMLHLVDLALRKAVGDQLKHGIELGLDMQVLTSKLSIRRSNIVKDIKQGSIVLPPFEQGQPKDTIIQVYKNILHPLLKDC